jgi:hypothetical protein
MSKALFDDETLYRGDKPHEKKVAMPDGSMGTFYIIDLRDHVIQSYFGAAKTDDDSIEANDAALISAALREPDGVTEAISVDRAKTLRTSFRKSLVHAILDVNGFIRDDKTGSKAGN